MAPTKNKPKIGSTKPVQQEQKTVFEFSSYYERYKKYIFDPEHLGPVCCLLFVFEILLNVFIIERVNYTEIDWKAYMQEVEGFLNGTLDYKELKGDTGPLVYPAGFVYIYSALYYVTNRGQNIHLAQYIFLVIYLAQTLLTYRLYWKTVKIPPYALALAAVTSYRVHSIFVLRLFNDPIAVLLFYVALNMFISDKWVLGSIFYSLGVSVKMNVLLYAPCLLIAYLTNLGVLQTAVHLAICAAVQLVLGLPFLLTNPFSYIKGSFDLGRIFEHKWTVNYRFLPIDLFENRLFHASLLVVHVVLLLIFAPIFKRYLTSYAKLNVVTQQVKEQLREERLKREKERQKADQKLSKQEKSFLDAFEKQMKKQPTAAGHDGLDETTKLENKMSKVTRLFVLPFFVANLIGIVCARSLHYQFYSWYFHSLLYLVFSTGYSKPVSFLLLGAIEYCWNVYPSTDMSSILLHLCHVILLVGVYRTMR